MTNVEKYIRLQERRAVIEEMMALLKKMEKEVNEAEVILLSENDISTNKVDFFNNPLAVTLRPSGIVDPCDELR